MPTAVERKSTSSVVTLNGGTREIPILSFGLGVISQRDPQSGLPTGKRQHKPIVITKQWDSSSPTLYQAVVSNESLSEVTIEFVDEWLSFTNARFIDFTRHGGVEAFTFEYGDVETGQGAGGRPVLDDWELEQIAFTFQKIQYSYSGGKSATDDWESRV